MEVAPFIEAAPEPARQPVVLAVDNTSEAQPAPAINSDADLAKLCLRDPSQLTAGRARLLDEILSRRNGRELLRISGVDLDALEGLLRSAA